MLLVSRVSTSPQKGATITKLAEGNPDAVNVP